MNPGLVLKNIQKSVLLSIHIGINVDFRMSNLLISNFLDLIMEFKYYKETIFIKHRSYNSKFVLKTKEKNLLGKRRQILFLLYFKTYLISKFKICVWFWILKI